MRVTCSVACPMSRSCCSMSCLRAAAMACVFSFRKSVAARSECTSALRRSTYTRARTCACLYTHFGYRLLRDDPQLIYEAHLRYARARLLCWRVDRTLCAFDPALVPTAPARHLLLDRCSCVCKQCMQACADVCMHTCLRWCVRACAQAKQRSWRRWGSSTRRWRIDL